MKLTHALLHRTSWKHCAEANFSFRSHVSMVTLGVLLPYVNTARCVGPTDSQTMAEESQPPPYDEPVPPSYEYVHTGVCYVPKKPSSELSVVDFLPEDANIRFPTLIGRANDWLFLNPEWEARACESIEFKSKGGIPLIQEVTFNEHNTGTTYIRGLRLWLVPRRDVHLPPQKLAYFDTVPKRQHEFLHVQFERLESVMHHLNNRLTTNPIDGLIITVETQPIKYSTSHGTLDPDRTHFTDFGFSVFVIRVFYEVGIPASESVGVVDFFPRLCNRQFDFIPDLANLADQWSRDRPNVRISNVQTVAMKMKEDHPNNVDDTKMSIREDRSNEYKTRYLRILRLFYVCTPEDIIAVTYMSPFQGPLTCKTFLPVQLTNGYSFKPEFETTQETLTRISDWVQKYNVCVLSVETVPVRMYTGGAKYGPESTYFYNKSGTTEQFINTVRLFLDGEYPDPPLSICPIAYQGWSEEPITEDPISESS